ncbi:MAG: hypothetical protein AAF598_17575, partial [Bacteroidota bacterium]
MMGITVSTEVPGQNRGLLTKFDFGGNRIWERIYGDSLKTSEPENLRRSMAATSDGNLVFTGYNRNGFGPFNTFLYKIDATTGDELFCQQFYNDDPSIGLSGNWVIETQDLGFLIGIDIRVAYGSTLIIKTDQNGIEEWRQTILNPGGDLSDFTMMGTNLTNGNVFFSTRVSKIDCRYNPDWFVQSKFTIIDLNGNTLDELITDSLSNINIFDTAPTLDGGVLVVGGKNYQWPNQNGSVPFRCGGNPYVAKYNAHSNLLWEKEITTDLTWFSQWWQVKEIENGGIAVSGVRYFGDPNAPDGPPVSGDISFFSPLGESIWSREIRPEWDNNFYNVLMTFSGLEEVEDGGFFLS